MAGKRGRKAIMEYDFTEQVNDAEAVKSCLRVKFVEPFQEFITKMTFQQINRLHEYATAQKNMDRVIEWLVNETNLKQGVEDLILSFLALNFQ